MYVPKDKDELIEAMFNVATDDEADVLTSLLERVGVLWKCKCSYRNPSDVQSCEGCGHPRWVGHPYREGMYDLCDEPADFPDEFGNPTEKTSEICGLPRERHKE